jgi:hypothetical protein
MQPNVASSHEPRDGLQFHPANTHELAQACGFCKPYQAMAELVGDAKARKVF